MRGMRHHLPAEIPIMDGKIVFRIIGDAGEDDGLLMDRVLDGDAHGRPVGRFSLAAVQHIDERGLAHLAMADEDRPHALELLGEQTLAESFEIGVDFRRALRKLLLGQQRPLTFYLPIDGLSGESVLIPLDPNLEPSAERLQIAL